MRRRTVAAPSTVWMRSRAQVVADEEITPLGRVLKGHGNDGASGFEGVLGGPSANVVGTYLHGPLLPKNAWFADWLIGRATGVDELAPLDDAVEDAAHASARRAAGV